MKEIWKNITDYEELYQISNLGNIKNTKRNKIKKKTINKDGYYVAKLSKNNIKKVFLVHRLVAKEFVKNKNNYNIVNHKDENKLNNRADNLEWCTVKYNNNYGTRHFKYKSKKYINEILDLLKNENKENDNIQKAINILEKIK